MRSAMGIWAEVGAMDVSKKAVAEADYIKTGPWVMTIEVNGKREYICGITPRSCVNRADKKFGNWQEIEIKTQMEFFNE